MKISSFGYELALVTLFVAIMVGCCRPASAQTYVGGGGSLIRSSSYDPSPAQRNDGGKTFTGAYVEGGYQFPLGLQARFLGEYRGEPTLVSIFTSDTKVGKTPKDEFRLRSELRLRPGCKDVKFCLFVGGGADYFRQRFDGRVYKKYEDGDYAAGLNPFFTVGAEFAEYYEVNFRRLFTDKTSLNRSNLHGYSVEASYTKPLAGHLHFKLSGQVDYLIFNDSIGYYVGNYNKRDAAVILRGGFLFK